MFEIFKKILKSIYRFTPKIVENIKADKKLDEIKNNNSLNTNWRKSKVIKSFCKNKFL